MTQFEPAVNVDTLRASQPKEVERILKEARPMAAELIKEFNSAIRQLPFAFSWTRELAFDKGTDPVVAHAVMDMAADHFNDTQRYTTKSDVTSRTREGETNPYIIEASLTIFAKNHLAKLPPVQG
ncbi:MAG: hypothetical protein AB9869_03650 [Verrucomicrobiia bacterium]